MPHTDTVPVCVDEWTDENFVLWLLDAEASLRAQSPESLEARCDRIVRHVMTQVAELPLPASDCPAD